MKCDDKEWKDCRVEKMGCKGCYYDDNIIGKRVKILHKRYDGITGKVVEKRNNEYKIKLDNKIGGCEYYIATDDGFTTIETIEENAQTRHVTISTEKLKELIKENYKWNDYTLQGKIDIVTSLAYFENDKELLKFLEYIEE